MIMYDKEEMREEERERLGYVSGNNVVCLGAAL